MGRTVEEEALFSIDKRLYVQISSAGPRGCSVTQTVSVSAGFAGSIFDSRKCVKMDFFKGGTNLYFCFFDFLFVCKEYRGGCFHIASSSSQGFPVSVSSVSQSSVRRSHRLCCFDVNCDS